MNKFSRLLSTLAISLVALLPLASPAEAISFSLNLDWEGFGETNPLQRYFLTGTFTAEDLNNDKFIRANSADFTEISNFAIKFVKDPDTNLVEYSFSDITGDPSFVFNYDIDNKTILQSGDNSDAVQALNSLYIGKSTGQSFSGFSLDSFSVSSQNVLKLFDVNDTNRAQGGTLTASAPAPVPFEFEASGGMLMLGAAWLWRKKLQKKAAND